MKIKLMIKKMELIKFNNLLEKLLLLSEYMI